MTHSEWAGVIAVLLLVAINAAIIAAVIHAVPLEEGDSDA